MKRVLVLTVCLVLLFVGVVKADSLYLGGNFSQPIYMVVNGIAKTEGGGSIDPSMLNGVDFKFLYCVDISTIVYMPGSYPDTQVNNQGKIYGSDVNNAAEVAWLLNKYGIPGQGDQQIALQAAIWHVVAEGTGNTVDLNTVLSSANQISLYDSMLTALDSNTGNIGAFLWITPGVNSNGQLVQYQGLVGTVPEPGILILLGIALSAVGLASRRRKS